MYTKIAFALIAKQSNIFGEKHGCKAPNIFFSSCNKICSTCIVLFKLTRLHKNYELK